MHSEGRPVPAKRKLRPYLRPGSAETENSTLKVEVPAGMVTHLRRVQLGAVGSSRERSEAVRVSQQGWHAHELGHRVAVGLARQEGRLRSRVHTSRGSHRAWNADRGKGVRGRARSGGLLWSIVDSP